MATVRTLCSTLSSGFKCVQVKMNRTTLLKNLNSVCFNSARHSSYRSSPAVGDDSLYTKYEISRSPAEWSFVERLVPKPTVPQPSPKPTYPSGWVPPKGPAPDSPYFVQRTRQHMVPVYLQGTGPRFVKRWTRVRYVHGDVWALERDIRAYLTPRLPPKTILTSHVNEVTCGINFDGDYVNLIKKFLISKGM